MSLDGKVAIVTGGGAGIGEAIVHTLAHKGAAVLIADLPGGTGSQVRDAVIAHGGKAALYEGDLTEDNHAEACVKAAIDAFGKLDILASNAGVFTKLGEVDCWSSDDFDHLVRNNTKAGFLMTKYALPELRKTRGCIVFTGSTAGIKGASNLAVYGASKAFVLAFMKGVAQEQAKYGIRVNAVAPGAIATSWTATDKGGPLNEEYQGLIADSALMGRLGTPEEMANVVGFLASDEASYVTGSIFVADGGVVVAQGLPGKDVPDELKQAPEPKRALEHSGDGLHNSQRK